MRKFLRSLLLLALLVTGSNSMRAAVIETVGNPDLSTGYFADASTPINLKNGQVLNYTFTSNRSTGENWFGWLLFVGT